MAAAIREQGQIVYEKVLWPIVFTQRMIVARKAGGPAAAALPGAQESPAGSRWPQPPAERIASLFLVLGLVLGTGYALIMPPLQVADEGSHLMRAYGISRGRCVATVEIPVPRALDELQVRFPDKVERNRRVTAGELRSLVRVPLHQDSVTPVTAVAANLYNCLPYFPQAAALRLGSLVNGSPLALMYLARLANLAAFIVITWLALRMLPDFRLLLLLLALMPMTLTRRPRPRLTASPWPRRSFSAPAR